MIPQKKKPPLISMIAQPTMFHDGRLVVLFQHTPIFLAQNSRGVTLLGRKNEKSSTASDLYLMVHPNRQWITTEHYPYTDLTGSRPIPAVYRYLWGAQKKDF